MLNVYRASAGSGKTHRLTRDYIHLLFSDKSNNKMYRRILAVTFTNKATDEMKSRILDQLFRLASGQKSDYRDDLTKKFQLSEEKINEKARDILISLLHDYSSFSVSTIDRFFQQIIRSFARENGINGAYNLELDNKTILEQATDNLFIDLSDKKNSQLFDWIIRFATDRVTEGQNWNPRNNILELGQELFKENFQSKADEVAKKIQDHNFLTSYKSDLYAVIKNFDNKISGIANKALQIMKDFGLEHGDFSYSTTKKFDNILSGIYKEPGSRFSDMADDVEKCYAKKQTQDIKTRINNAYNDGLGDCFRKTVDLLSSGMKNYNTANIILRNINTLGMLSYLDMQIKNLTEDQNSMLISDANMLVNKIIDGSDTPFIYEKTGVFTDHFMIDEFQDTSSLQWKNFKPLIENSLANGNFNLVVGDVKQSIYRWRNSDWKLLDKSIFSDFRKELINEINLDTNWRSDRNIVDFNNVFFSYASCILQAKLNEKLPDENNVSDEFKSLKNSIVHAYDKPEQKISPNAGEGFLSITFLDSGENDEKWQEESLRRLPSLLESIQDQGFQPKDVAILVREKKETKLITQKLLEYKKSDSALVDKYCYDVLGNEGLLISKSGAVGFITSLLQLLIHPDDAVSRLKVSYEFLKGKFELTENEALKKYFADLHGKDVYCHYFTDAENDALRQLSALSLYEMTELIINLFGISAWKNEKVFLQAFQDEVFKFSTGRKSDIGSFLQWWNETGIEKFIPVPENQNAFQIMTIHKSKGLDFKVVIIPFCDWELDLKKGNLKNYLWCRPSVMPFSQLSVLPVEYSNQLENSIFEFEFYNEKMHRYIDNLNLAYVAFTRAKNQLICFTGKVKTPENINSVNSVSDLLTECFLPENRIATEKPALLTGNFNPETNEFRIGQPSEFVQSNVTIPAQSENPENFSGKGLNEKLLLKTGRQKIISGAEPAVSGIRDFGIIMHEVLSRINRKVDQPKAIQQVIREGLASEQDKDRIEWEMEKFWSLNETEEWFSGEGKILKEVTVLTPDGNMYRPDRVVIRENNATIIDYKFGEKENRYYFNQIKKYMALISEMGFSVRGFIYYINLEKLVEVK